MGQTLICDNCRQVWSRRLLSISSGGGGTARETTGIRPETLVGNRFKSPFSPLLWWISDATVETRCSLSISLSPWFWRFLVQPTNENPHRETIKIYLLHGFLRRNANAFRTHKTEKKKTSKTPCKLIRPHNHPLPAKMQKRHGHTKK